LDGLVIGNIIIVAFTLAILSYFVGCSKIASYFKVINVLGAEEIAVFLFAVIGASLGFLWYNFHPAEIFMGDTGSLFLGGILGMVSVFIKQEFVFFCLSGIFVIETLSVIIQIFYYKLTGNRMFKMAPIHHHFEMSGLSETKITIRFWIMGIIFSVFSFILFVLWNK
jgi:phospho-N-acetylmuramoyl-pentapeptide-transferase